MALDAESKQKIQLALAFAVLIAGARTAYILYERHAAATESTAKAAPPLNPDYYVTPKKLYAYDLKSAKQLTQQPVWVKEGYRYPYFPYDPAAHRVNFEHSAGMLLPLQKLEIKDVVLDKAPDSGAMKQVMATFEQDGKIYAVQVGTEEGSEYKIFSDGMLFIEDPHELYKHWPADVWEAISRHEVKPGMNEIQVIFAIGVGLIQGSGSDPNFRTLRYPNGGKPLLIAYENGKAASIKPAEAEQ
jgi:hypothetical protein